MGARRPSLAALVPLLLLLSAAAAPGAAEAPQHVRFTSHVTCGRKLTCGSTPLAVNTIPRGGGGVELKEGRRRRRGALLPKRLFSAARGLIGRTANIVIRRPRKRVESEEVDHTFDELDRILESGNMTGNITEHGNGSRIEEADKWIDSLPQGASLPKGWKERSLSAWINGLVSRETSRAIDTIQSIVEAFPDYGVVDIFALYSPRDVIWSIVALSRLQRVLQSDPEDDETSTEEEANTAITDRDTLEELAHYCAFANAAYGWKSFAFCGWLHLGGNNRVLIKSTGIARRDIVTANWHSKANRPAYYVARDRKRKAIVLGIRGTASARDILTDLCASAENFFVEDGHEIGDIIESEESTTPPLLVGRAHKGMIDASKSVARMTGKTISDELDAHPDYSLVIVGHSLGAGVAACLAAMWSRRFPDRVRSIGYASPCVFPSNCTTDFDSVCVSVMGERDPFATISLGHLADVTKALSSLCRDKGLREEILQRTKVALLANPRDISRGNYEWCESAMAALRKEMDSEKLLPPGTVYRMSGPLLDFQPERKNATGNGKITSLRTVDARRLYNELRLHARMFDLSLHIPLRYETILRRLASTEV